MVVVLVALLVALAFSGVGRADAQEDPRTAAVHAAQADYGAAGADVVSLTQLVEDLHNEQGALADELSQLDGQRRDAVEHLAAAQTLAQRYAVEAYVSGTDLRAEDALFTGDTSGDNLYREYLLQDHAVRTREVLHDFATTRDQADQRLAELAEVRATNARELAEAERDLDLARQRWQLADGRLRAADHAFATFVDVPLDGARPAGFVASGDDGGPTPAQSGNASGAGWDGLRRCESGGNYAAVSPSGQYRGAYQFDVTTWRGMGGTGDPALAPPSEQDYRAQLLYNQRGAQPWPVCGRYLVADPTLHPVPAVPPPPVPTYVPPVLPTVPTDARPGPTLATTTTTSTVTTTTTVVTTTTVPATTTPPTTPPPTSTTTAPPPLRG